MPSSGTSPTSSTTRAVSRLAHTSRPARQHLGPLPNVSALPLNVCTPDCQSMPSRYVVQRRVFALMPFNRFAHGLHTYRVGQSSATIQALPVKPPSSFRGPSTRPAITAAVSAHGACPAHPAEPSSSSSSPSFHGSRPCFMQSGVSKRAGTSHCRPRIDGSIASTRASFGGVGRSSSAQDMVAAERQS